MKKKTKTGALPHSAGFPGKDMVSGKNRIKVWEDKIIVWSDKVTAYIPKFNKTK